MMLLMCLSVYQSSALVVNKSLDNETSVLALMKSMDMRLSSMEKRLSAATEMKQDNNSPVWRLTSMRSVDWHNQNSENSRTFGDDATTAASMRAKTKAEQRGFMNIGQNGMKA